MHALIAWYLKFQVCLGYTFTPATLLAMDKEYDTNKNNLFCIAPPKVAKASKVAATVKGIDI
jgi:hypothetical protein